MYKKNNTNKFQYIAAFFALFATLLIFSDTADFWYYFKNSVSIYTISSQIIYVFLPSVSFLALFAACLFFPKKRKLCAIPGSICVLYFLFCEMSLVELIENGSSKYFRAVLERNDLTNIFFVVVLLCLVASFIVYLCASFEVFSKRASRFILVFLLVVFLLIQSYYAFFKSRGFSNYTLEFTFIFAALIMMVHSVEDGKKEVNERIERICDSDE